MLDFNEQIAEFEPGLEDQVEVVLLVLVAGPHRQQVHGARQPAVEEPYRGDDVTEPERGVLAPGSIFFGAFSRKISILSKTRSK